MDKTPAISQWPMVVSFPLEASFIRAILPRIRSSFSRQSTPSRFPKPKAHILGICKNGLSATDFNVFVPLSP